MKWGWTLTFNHRTSTQVSWHFWDTKMSFCFFIDIKKIKQLSRWLLALLSVPSSCNLTQSYAPFQLHVYDTNPLKANFTLVGMFTSSPGWEEGCDGGLADMRWPIQINHRYWFDLCDCVKFSRNTNLRGTISYLDVSIKFHLLEQFILWQNRVSTF